ncbi:hypothetical protein IMG5_154470 [Ichthyophthirius multifiliis]|uniref:PCI domain-containing protein n=1 Tax=Ichthyophthirius multifiliis TaxID=5932 RepID=G0QZ50_ICHMU|nr:hypothetical protein IMG5_154470 [Ichthyophthirius multifiliis]EGR29501.1 hypothetical protein IMG5_154470 [Ichthyophthirius multifiliis]|eukprot:XP_004030737.1 hypothetical protein IMG5_154470 [Ichthyophthirius multifiliis]
MSFFNQGKNDQSDSESDRSQEQDDRRAKNEMMDILDSSSEEDEKRKVLSEKDKRFNQMKEIISNIKQKLERHEFTQVEEEFKKLNKELEKAKKVIDETGIPSFYIRVLYRLDDKLRNFSKEEKDKLSQANSKAFNAIKQDESGSEQTDSDFKSDSSDDSIHPLESDDPMVRRKFWLLKPGKKNEVEKEKSLGESSDEEKQDDNKHKKQKVNKDNIDYKITEVSKEKEIVINTSYEGTIIQSISTFYNTIIFELNKSFYSIEHTQEEYFQRIGDIYEVLRLGKQIQEFYDQIGLQDIAAKIAFQRLENMYFIHENTLDAQRKYYKQKNLSIKDHIFDENTSLENIISELSSLINRTPDQDIARSTLYQVYHHSIHNRINAARDLLLMSRITDTIQNMDSTIQTLYNRVLVQLGLGQFRQGNLFESFQFLNDLCSQGKTKELIGQNPLRYLSQNDRKKIFPPHQHLKVDMIETFYLIVSMLIEIPNMISDSYNKHIFSRMFRKLCEQYNRSVIIFTIYFFYTIIKIKHFVGVPESSKEYIYAASKELQKGNWKNCYKLIIEAPVWNGALYCEETKKILLQRVKEQSYKCHLYTFKNSFDSVSLSELSQKFELSETEINAITFKMISSNELNAHIHTLNNQLHIVFEHVDRTSLQSISSKLIDQIQNTQNQNQKILDKKVGNQSQTQGNKQEDELNDQTNKQGFIAKQKKKATFQAAPPGKRGTKKNTKRAY